ncbi:MAG TPA: ABC transporter permease [Bryobacteraceae bacterium]|jgi:predicted permease|nr:ABC transporter permease [Bryobacteraceae bacterium]
MKTLLRRLAVLLPFMRRRREHALEEELASYLEMAEEAARANGLSLEQARRAAYRDLGNLTLTRESVRSRWIPPKLEHFAQDIHYVVRSFRREPLFATIAICSLAFGIGAANTAFSLVDGILLKPLAYVKAGQLAYVREFVPALSHLYPEVPVNYQHFRYWQSHNQKFQGMAAFRASRDTLTGAGEPVQVDSVETTAGLFDVLRTKLPMGRAFRPEEDRPGHTRVAVISDALWRTRFHSDSNIIGRHISYGGVPVEIVGVLPQDFTFPAGNDLGQLAGLGKRVQIFEPIRSAINGWDGDYDYIVLARLRAGASLSEGLAELTVLTRQLTAAYQVESKPHPVAKPLQEAIGGSVRESLWVLFASVLVLLLIVCVNLTNLMLARAHGRIREFSIRAALGAGRIRLMQQILTEACFISALGGICGIGFAAACIRALKVNTAYELPRILEVHIDARVVLFSVSLTILCACISGLLPAYRAAQSDLQTAMRSRGPAISPVRHSLRLRQTLVGCEVALSTVLVCLAGLLIASLFNLLHVDKGFEEKHATAIDINLPEVRYPDAPSRARFFDQILARVSTLPGIRSAAIVQGLPLTGESMINGIELEGSGNVWFTPSSNAPILVNVRFVSPEYFQTVGIPLLKGRGIEPQDRNRRVAVLSQRLAAKVWPGENVLGKEFKTGSQVGKVKVVGIVRDTYNGRLDDQPTLIVYVPYWIRPPWGASLVFRASGTSDPLIRRVQHAIWSIDPSLPVSEVRTLSELVAAATARRRFQMELATAFGLAALLLTLIGVYGIVAYNVQQRKGELGLRLALGAKRGELVLLMMRYGLMPVLAGLGCGLLVSLAMGSLVRALIFGVTSTDPITLSGVSLLLVLTAGIACLVPAIRVITLEPASILQYE